MKTKKEITGLLFSSGGENKVVHFVDELENLYELINCEMIEMPVRKIGDREYVFIVDEEFLLKQQDEVIEATAVWTEDQLVKEVLLGNVLVCKETKNGQLKSLSDDDIEYIRGAIVKNNKPVRYVPNGFANEISLIKIGSYLKYGY